MTVTVEAVSMDAGQQCGVTSWEGEGYGCRHRLSWAAAAGLHGSSLCHSSSVMKGMMGDSSVNDTDTQWKSTLSSGASRDAPSPC